jgi:nitrite reductase/ring-hydroxylating ferredoxin subunit
MPIDQRTRALALKDRARGVPQGRADQIVRALKADPRGKELLLELVDDQGVYALFALHGIVKADLRTRVAAVIETVRPYTQSHGGDVTLVDVRGIRCTCASRGPATAAACRPSRCATAWRRRSRNRCPKSHASKWCPTNPMRRPHPVSLKRARWVTGGSMGRRLADVSADAPYRFELDGKSRSVSCCMADRVRPCNACAHLGLPIDGGRIDREPRTITCPWHGFRFDCMSGECLTAPQAQLEQVPLRVVDGRVQLRPEREAARAHGRRVAVRARAALGAAHGVAAVCTAWRLV